MERIKARIVGESALMMHSYPMVPIEALEKKPPAEQAELATYRTPDGLLYVPGVNFWRALVSGATYVKGKGRASMQKPVAASVLVSPEYLILPTQTFTLDARPVVIPSTKGRVMRYRPRFDEWSFDVVLDFDENLVNASELRRVVDETGRRVGLLEFRPERKGPFGRFRVDEWIAA